MPRHAASRKGTARRATGASEPKIDEGIAPARPEQTDDNEGDHSQTDSSHVPNAWGLDREALKSVLLAMLFTTNVNQQERDYEHREERERSQVIGRPRENGRAAQEAERSRLRKSQVSTGDRSAKIRTYNFPQNRVTDHRINYTSHDLPAVLNGDLGSLIEAFKLATVEEQLSGGGN